MIVQTLQFKLEAVCCPFQTYSCFIAVPLLLCIYITQCRACYEEVYSGTPLNGHPSTADTCDKTDSSKSPKRIPIDFNTLKTPELRTPRYSVKRTPFAVPTRLRS